MDIKRIDVEYSIEFKSYILRIGFMVGDDPKYIAMKVKDKSIDSCAEALISMFNTILKMKDEA